MMDAIDAGCDDVKDQDEEVFELITSVENFNKTVKELEDKGYKLGKSDIIYLAENEIDVDPENYKSLLKLIDTLEDNDDVQEVYTNRAMPDNLELE
jgi:transcriptional/translational regulatory protein YebC/TACO1